MKKFATLSFSMLLIATGSFGKNATAIDGQWQNTVTSQIKTQQYNFNAKGGSSNFNAYNLKNDLFFNINQGGYEVKHSSNTKSGLWTTSFRLTALSGEQPKFRIVEQKNQQTLVYQYQNAAVRYTNSENGLRQDFIFPEKPKSGALSVTMKISQDLAPKLLSDSKLALTGKDGQTKVIYDDLHVWDANHRTLAASFSITGNQLSINVDDKNAIYPVTIDPLTRNPEWNTSADGLLTGILSGQLNSSLYGFTVKGIGDVNGDGFGDVAVGAPALSSLLSGSVAKVGAVYIFHGSATGLSTTPSNILQPSTAVAGALFGFSIDGADVDGDGLSDILVGAPLDQITVSIIGPVQASVGKVYYYSGASLTASNPGTFLSVNINTSNFGALNVGVKSLFGFSVAFTDDLNGDAKKDFIVGAPGFQASLIASAKVGGAYVFKSTTTGYDGGTALNAPTLLSALGAQISIGDLLFGYSVDGAGDYNGDGKMDVVVGAPGGDGISSLTGLLAGQLLSGRAVIYYGTGAGVNTNPGTQLSAGGSALLGNVGNLFGFSVKGLKNVNGVRTGGIAVGAPLAGTLSNLLSLTIQTGSVHIFRPNNAAPAQVQSASIDILESPQSPTILSLLNSYNLNALMGASIDNMYDANGDGYPDLIVGEPLSTGTNLAGLQTALTGGHAYVYGGNSTGGFDAVPIFTVNATYGTSFASTNAAPLFGYSVTGVRNLRGPGTNARVVVGSPAASLDFGSGLLDVGGTVNSLLSFTAGNNGPGSAYSFDAAVASPLAVHLLSFAGRTAGSSNQLSWKVASNKEISSFELQRSANGKSWEVFSKMAASGNGTEHTYTQVDEKPFDATTYYRLKISYNGKEEDYSKVVVLHNDPALASSVLLYPNPVTDFVTIKTANAAMQTLNVTSENGALVARINLGAGVDGAQKFSKAQLGLNVSGIYTLEIISKDGSSVRKMLLVK